MSIKIERSRFAALKIEDDDDNEKQSNNQTNAKNNLNKNKKGKTNSNNKNQHNIKNKVKQFEKTDWETWKQKDEEFVDELYKEHLKQALIESKVEFETKKNEAPKQEIGKHKQNKPVVMSLDEFQKSFETNGHKNGQQKTKQSDSVKETEKFIDEIDDKLDSLLLKDKMLNHEHLDKDQSAEKYLSLQYKEEISKRDKEIALLHDIILSLKDENNEVKKRNQQLAIILASGEMKEKSELIVQINELNTIKNELTTQVGELHKNLEQEKSKVHHLENELKKNKKH